MVNVFYAGVFIPLAGAAGGDGVGGGLAVLGKIIPPPSRGARSRKTWHRAAAAASFPRDEAGGNGYGGGIYVADGSVIDLLTSTITGNSASGGTFGFFGTPTALAAAFTLACRLDGRCRDRDLRQHRFHQR